MNYLKLVFLAGTAAMLVMGITGSALAFHDGGVAPCDGCHTMHNTYKGVKQTTGGTVLQGNVYLLKGVDPSSTCLNCHGAGTVLLSYAVDTNAAGFNGTTLPVQRTPGGDFAWLKVSYNSAAGTFGTTANEGLNRQGHHIVASDFAFLANTDNAGVAPGSDLNYQDVDLSCVSCHNPHSKLTLDGSTLPISGSGSYGGTPAAGTAFGVYRLLGGIGYTTPSSAGGTTPAFTAVPPTAVAPAIYNQSEAVSQVRVAYGRDMSEWCANCHDLLINVSSDATVTHRHVASDSALLTTPTPGGEIPASIYNEYINSGNTTGGTQTTSYLSLVPYELGSTDDATLLTYQGNGGVSDGANVLAGPVLGTENVMCLSCHRAHASGFDSSLRFDVSQTFITTTDSTWAYTNSGTGSATLDASGYYQAAYYDRLATVFGPSQRVLCNKCHGQG
jgi:hypothetical protein